MGYLVKDLVKFLCDQCKAKYQIADDKIAGKTVKMKCRKCGHQIEVRAAVTETSVASKAPEDAARNAASGAAAGAPAGPPRPGAPAAPRVGSLATSLASAKPAPPRGAPPPKPERPGALAGAFKSNVTNQRDEEISASFDLAELSAADEWYVAINGVPVGPIRIQEVRRKAALGAVTEDSLVWQEGLEEWRPVRAFTELASVVLEAATSGRTSLLTPAPADVRTSPSSPPGPVGGSNRPAPPRSSNAPRGPGASPAPAPVRQNVMMTPAPGAAAAARSNVVPFTSRLATAERLDDATIPMTDELRASFAPDPFASPPSAAAGAASLTPGVGASSGVGTSPALGGATAVAVPAEAPPAKRAPPWIAIAMIVLAAAFGITAALALFLKAPQPVVIQMPSGVPQAQPPPSTGSIAAIPTDSSPLPQASGASSSSTGPGKPSGSAIALASGTKPTAAPSATTPGFKVSGLDDTGPKVGTGGTSGAEAPKPGQCLTQVQVQSVIQARQSGLKRTCWDKSSSTRATVNIGVMLTIGPGGEVQSVSAQGEDSGVAHCVESDVRAWHFPAGGCVQQSGFAVHFVRQ